MTRLAPLALMLALDGCASSTATRYWTIEPLAAARSSVASPVRAPVRIDGVRVPLAIDRLEVVSHDAENRVIIHDFDRWSAPPADLLQRTLTQDLQTRLPSGAVIFPASPKPSGAIGVFVDILDLRQTADGYAMQVSWSATTNGDAGTVAAPIRRTLTLQATGMSDVAGQTIALGTITGQLADSIVDAIGQRRTPPRP